ncbi:MAG: site-specific integrase [Vicinamibacteria bacterium]|nr:site-specific integrase [Vicinamibacteria bacterium]
MARREQFTKASVEALQARASDYFVWDVKVPRLAVRVRPGGGKHYVLRLTADGRQRWYTIGKHGDPWVPETAREEAERVLGQAANVSKLRETGAAPPSLLHPIEAREAHKKVPTLAEFAPRYLEQHAIVHKKAGTLAADLGLLGLRRTEAGEWAPTDHRRTILAALGDARVDRLSQHDVAAFHVSWKDTPTRANRAVALLSHMFTKAEAWGLRAPHSNPCRHVERFGETKRERFLSAQELTALGRALDKHAKEERLSPFALAAIRLLVLTGARASEVLGLKWSEVNIKAGVARLADSKTGAKSLFLPPAAQKVLKALPKLDGNPYVIAGARPGLPLTLSGLEQVWQEVREAAKLEDVRLHDLRHSFASVAAGGGASLPIIGALLGHTTAETTKRYAHLAASPLADAARVAGQSIAAAMTKKPAKRGQR